MNKKEIEDHKKTATKAMEIILQEYKDKEHLGGLDDCSLCREYYVSFDNPEKCTKCPMNIFEEVGYNLGCTERKCHIIECDGKYDYRDLRHERVIMFYEKVLKSALKYKDLRPRNNKGNLTYFGKFLIKLDKEVANREEFSLILNE
jgi:hypothetical protein